MVDEWQRRSRALADGLARRTNRGVTPNEGRRARAALIKLAKLDELAGQLRRRPTSTSPGAARRQAPLLRAATTPLMTTAQKRAATTATILSSYGARAAALDSGGTASALAGLALELRPLVTSGRASAQEVMDALVAAALRSVEVEACFTREQLEQAVRTGLSGSDR